MTEKTAAGESGIRFLLGWTRRLSYDRLPPIGRADATGEKNVGIEVMTDEAKLFGTQPLNKCTYLPCYQQLQNMRLDILAGKH